MGYFDCSREPKSDIAFVDMRSFYASVECVERGLHPLRASLCVMRPPKDKTIWKVKRLRKNQPMEIN